MSKFEEKVIEKIRVRAKCGLQKYGVTMERKDLTFREWMIHLQEELMDAAVYVERLIQESECPIHGAETHYDDMMVTCPYCQ